ncbi:MAG: DUF4157 domain-containing protein [Gammaproteobacteria bacterium]|nr:DUF4157 domain-containing protein [Gammaproteobacteria bacterium]
MATLATQQTSKKPQFSNKGRSRTPVLQRKCHCGGRCASCQADASRLEHSPYLQAKLRVGAPDDRYEREADRIADQVMRMPEPGLQRQVDEEGEEELLQAKPVASQITPVIQRQVEPEEEEEEETLQSKSESTPAHTVAPSIRGGISQLRQSGGAALPAATRAFIEPRFGHDFTHVKIHDNPLAADLSRSVNARAFTVGHDIFFNQGEFQPTTPSGMRLLAHELTHTLQQGFGVIRRKGENVPGSQAVFDFAQQILNGEFNSSEFAEALAAQDFTRLQLRDLQERVLDLQTTSDPRIDAALEEIDNVLAGLTDLDKVTFVPKPCEPGDSASVDSDTWTANQRLFGIAEGTEAPLKRGDQGGAVTVVQQALLQWGCEYSPESVNLLPRYRDDGDYGRETYLGVKEFQSHHKLSADGVLGHDTLFKLQEEVLVQAILDEQRARQELAEAGETDTQETFQPPCANWEKLIDEHKSYDATRGTRGGGVALYHLQDQLHACNFGSVPAFEEYLDGLANDFRHKAYQFTLQYLDDFQSFLESQSAKYEDESVLTALWIHLAPWRELGELRTLAEEWQAYIDDPDQPVPEGDYEADPYDALEQIEEELRAKQEEFPAKQQDLYKEHPLLAVDTNREGSLASRLAESPRDDVPVVIKDFIASKQSDLAEARAKLKDNPDYIFAWDKIVAFTKQQSGMFDVSLQTYAVDFRIDRLDAAKLRKALGLAVIAIVGTAITGGAGLSAVGFLGAALAVGAGAADVYVSLEEYSDERLAYELGLATKDPWFGWVVLAALGVVADVVDVAKLGINLAKALKSSARSKEVLGAINRVKRSGIVDSFNKSEIDAFDLYKKLAKLEIADDIRTAIFRAAMARLDGVVVARLPDAVQLGEKAYRLSIVAKGRRLILRICVNPCPETDELLKLAERVRQKHAQTEGVENAVRMIEEDIEDLKRQKAFGATPDGLEDILLDVEEQLYELYHREIDLLSSGGWTGAGELTDEARAALVDDVAEERLAPDEILGVYEDHRGDPAFRKMLQELGTKRHREAIPLYEEMANDAELFPEGIGMFYLDKKGEMKRLREFLGIGPEPMGGSRPDIVLVNMNTDPRRICVVDLTATRHLDHEIKNQDAGRRLVSLLNTETEFRWIQVPGDDIYHHYKTLDKGDLLLQLAPFLSSVKK